MLEAPKIFKGSIAAHTDGALYLRNIVQSPMFYSRSISEESVNEQSREKEERVQNRDKNRKNIDRKQFY
jgi:hypothetical protein